MKKLSYAIAKNTGVSQVTAFEFLRRAAQSHAARMAHSSPARRAEIQAHYRAWIALVRATDVWVYYGAYFGSSEEYFG